MASGLIQGAGTVNTSYLRPFIWWQSTPDAANNRSKLDVRVIIDQIGAAGLTWAANCTGAHVDIGADVQHFATFQSSTVDGWTYSAAQSPTGNRAELIVQRLSFFVPHNSDGTKKITLGAGFAIGGAYATGTVTFPTTEITLDNISTTPGNVTGLTFGLSRDGTASLTWNAVSGATGYQVQRMIRNRAGTPGVWTNITTVTARSFSEDVTGITVGMVAGQSVKYRVRAMSGATGGNFTETFYLFLKGGAYHWQASGSTPRFGACWVRVGGAWRRCTGFYMRVGGAWIESKTEFQKEMGQ